MKPKQLLSVLGRKMDRLEMKGLYGEAEQFGLLRSIVFNVVNVDPVIAKARIQVILYPRLVEGPARRIAGRVMASEGIAALD